MKKFAALAVAGVLTLGGLSACGNKNVNIQQTGATKVPGVGNMYRVCDQSTLIYFTSYSGDDDYEAFFYGGCAFDKASGKFLPAIGADTEPRNGPATDEEMNQQDERDEN